MHALVSPNLAGKHGIKGIAKYILVNILNKEFPCSFRVWQLVFFGLSFQEIKKLRKILGSAQYFVIGFSQFLDNSSFPYRPLYLAQMGTAIGMIPAHVRIRLPIHIRIYIGNAVQKYSGFMCILFFPRIKKG